MGIICDHPGCTNRTHQPLPAGWDVEWIAAKRYEHRCPQHSKRGRGVSVEPDRARVPRKPPPKPQAPPKPDEPDQGSLF